MDLDRLNRWLTLAANVGVMLGLIVLVFELNQVRHLARSELGSDTVELITDTRLQLLNEPLRSAWATAIAAPGDLTDEDVIALDTYVTSLMAILHREEYLIQAGLYKDDRAIMARAISTQVLGNAFGKNWWIENRERYPEEFREIIDAISNEFSANRDHKYIERLRTMAATPP